ncbi:MAG: hypothetical protein LBC51_00745 [Treponema sp.]|nr:hypothetical protein [Treponema sp.]
MTKNDLEPAIEPGKAAYTGFTGAQQGPEPGVEDTSYGKGETMAGAKLQHEATKSGLMYGAVRQNPVFRAYKTVTRARANSVRILPHGSQLK